MIGMATAAAAGMAAPDLASLARRGRALGSQWSLATPTNFAFDSRYVKNDESRGWSNWLLEDRLMIGQYPHCQPAVPGPSAADAKDHLQAVLDVGIDCFVCLQAELPPQPDGAAWPEDGVRLGDAEDRAQWPDPFVRYQPEADEIAASAAASPPLRYLHCPIVDLSTPQMPQLLSLLDEIVQHYESGGQAAYVHCWGGRGRAGLVGACLLSLLRPELTAEAVLDEVQAGYDSRTGADAMPSALKRSPQTLPQRKFVSSFVSAVRASRRYDNDLDMQAGGMPKGYL